MDSLDQIQLKQLCNRLLCGHGGVGLAKSLLDSNPHGDEQHGSGRIHGVSVGTVRKWETQQRMSAAR